MSEQEQAELALKAKKRRTMLIWLRVIALMFVGFFFLSQCGMSKSRAKASIVQSCIDNVPREPFAKKWQADLRSQNIQEDPHGKYITRYCLCMWDEPLQKLGVKQIQSLATMSSEQRLELLGGAKAFEDRDRQCVANLNK